MAQTFWVRWFLAKFQSMVLFSFFSFVVENFHPTCESRFIKFFTNPRCIHLRNSSYRLARVCCRSSFVVSVPVLASSLALVVVCISPSLVFHPPFQCLPSTSFLSTQSFHLIETFFLFASAKSAAHPSQFRVMSSESFLQFWPSPDSYPRCKHQNCSITVSTKVAIFFASLLPCIKSPKHQKHSRLFSAVFLPEFVTLLLSGYAAMPLSQGCLCLLRSYYLDMLPCLCPRRNLCCRTSLLSML